MTTTTELGCSGCAHSIVGGNDGREGRSPGMRVLITTPDLSRQGGVSNYIALLNRYLSLRADLFVVGRRDRTEGRGQTLRRTMGDFIGFHKRVERGEYDLVHLNPSLAWKAVPRDGVLLALARRRGLKTLVFFHGWDKGFEGHLTGQRLCWFKRVYFKADAIVVLAREFERRLRAWGYTGPIYVETMPCSETLVDGFDLETRLRNDRRDVKLLFLARVERAKGIYETIDAFNRLKHTYPNLKLMIAGNGSEWAASRKYVHRSRIPDVEFVGYLRGQQKVEALRRADVYVFPSSHGEGMPTSIVEAMSLGLPVVTRAVAGVKDFFVDGKMGFMTESLDHRVVASLIERLIVNPALRGQIARYNHSYAMDHFMPARVVGRIERVYKEILREADVETPILRSPMYRPPGIGSPIPVTTLSHGGKEVEEQHDEAPPTC